MRLARTAGRAYGKELLHLGSCITGRVRQLIAIAQIYWLQMPDSRRAPFQVPPRFRLGNHRAGKLRLGFLGWIWAQLHLGPPVTTFLFDLKVVSPEQRCRLGNVVYLHQIWFDMEI